MLAKEQISLIIALFISSLTFAQNNVVDGMQHFEKADYKKAMLSFNQAIVESKDNAVALHMRGRVKQILEDYHGAMQDFNTAIKINSDNSQYYFERGNVKYKLQDYYGAISDYSAAIDKDVTYVDAYFKRGKAKQKLAAYKDAIHDCSKILEIKADNRDAYSLRGILLIEYGEVEKGCLDLSKAGELGDMKAYELIKEKCNSKR